MDTETSILADQRVKEWFLREKALREHERELLEPHFTPERAVITISREYGAGGHSVASRVAEELGPAWQVWDREIVNAIATNANVRQDMVDQLDERSHTFIDRLLSRRTEDNVFDEDQYYAHLVEVLVSLGQQGMKIIVGRGANYVLKKAFRVRLIASPEHRIRAIERRESLTHAEARSKMTRVDAERADFVRRYFAEDIAAPSGYNLIINMDHTDFDTATAAIVGGLMKHMAPKDGSVPVPTAVAA